MGGRVHIGCFVEYLGPSLMVWPTGSADASLCMNLFLLFRGKDKGWSYMLSRPESLQKILGVTLLQTMLIFNALAVFLYSTDSASLDCSVGIS